MSTYRDRFIIYQILRKRALLRDNKQCKAIKDQAIQHNHDNINKYEPFSRIKVKLNFVGNARPQGMWLLRRR